LSSEPSLDFRLENLGIISWSLSFPELSFSSASGCYNSISAVKYSLINLASLIILSGIGPIIAIILARRPCIVSF